MAVGTVLGYKAMALNGSSIRTTWNAATDATGYIVYRSFTASGGYSEVGRTTECEYIDRGLAAETLYYYKIRPYNADGNGGYSGACSATTLTSSDLGFIEKNILTDIADAIRETSETTAKLFPVEMPAMIRSIGGKKLYTGYFSGGGITQKEYSLGVSLPVYDNYTFMVMPFNSEVSFCGLKSIIGAITADYCRTKDAVYTNAWNIDFENGVISSDYFIPTSGDLYKWCYFEEDVG